MTRCNGWNYRERMNAVLDHYDEGEDRIDYIAPILFNLSLSIENDDSADF